MQVFRSLVKAVVLLTTVCAVATLHADDGLSDALSRLNSSGEPNSVLVGPLIATADFNRDAHPDGAVLLRSRNTFHIEVHFRLNRKSNLAFDSNLRALAIAAFDVNHDGTPDLVVEEPFSHRRLFIWLNDGKGFFHSARVDDFPAGSEDVFQRLAPTSPNPLGLVQLTAGKMRVRRSDHRLAHPLASALVSHPICDAAFDPAEPVSNTILRRGPPNPVLLARG
jgi:hypothetical protein